MFIWRAIKRMLVIVPLMSFTGMSVAFAYLLWLLLGEKACLFAMPFESWGQALMKWAER